LSDGNKYYYILLAELYERKKSYGDAIKVVQKLIKKIPNSDQYYLDLASLYIQDGKLEDALKALSKAESYMGISEEITRQKQQILLKQNKLGEAILEGKKLIKAYPDDARYAILLAEIYFTNNKGSEAIPILDSLLKNNHDIPYARLVLSDIYNNMGKKDKANEQLELAFKSQELDIDSKVAILLNYMRNFPNEDYKKTALKLGEITVKAHPKDAKAYSILGDIYSMDGRKQEALDNYLTCIKLDNSHFNVWQQVIVIASELNELDSMITYSNRAAEVFPNQGILYFYSGTGYLMKKKYPESVKNLERSKKLSANSPELLLQIHAQLGDAYNGIKEYKKSDESYDAVLKADPENAHALNNYSYFLSLRNDRLDLAKKMCEKLYQKYPDESTYLDTYAWVLYKLGEFPQAKELLEKACKNSNNGTILEHYGDVLYKLGQKDLANEQWKKAKELGENSEFIDKKIASKTLYE
jgi:tetratricopeptide (TPR) repeat protein